MTKNDFLSPSEQILLLRGQIAEAYEQNDSKRLQSLSRQMDEIQLRHWASCGSQPQEGKLLSVG